MKNQFTDFEKNEGAKVTKPHSSGGIVDTAVKLGEIVQNNIPYRLCSFIEFAPVVPEI
jgi:hypothetical protein